MQCARAPGPKGAPRGEQAALGRAQGHGRSIGASWLRGWSARHPGAHAGAPAVPAIARAPQSGALRALPPRELASALRPPAPAPARRPTQQPAGRCTRPGTLCFRACARGEPPTPLSRSSARAREEACCAVAQSGAPLALPSAPSWCRASPRRTAPHSRRSSYHQLTAIVRTAQSASPPTPRATCPKALRAAASGPALRATRATAAADQSASHAAARDA